MTATIPPRKGYQLGWARVAVRLVAEKGQVLDSDIAGFIANNRSAEGLTAVQGRLGSSAFHEPRQLAEFLGLIGEPGAGLTELGSILAERDAGSEKEWNPFEPRLDTSWLLWWSSAFAEPWFWRTAFCAWEPGQKLADWILTIAREAHAGHAPTSWTSRWATRDTLTTAERTRLVETVGRPRLGQLVYLGWSNELEALRHWAKSSPFEWSASDVLRCFEIGTGRTSRLPELESLLTVLSDLPEGARRGYGQEAPEWVVQNAAVAKGLSAGNLEDWFGPEYEAVVQQGRSLGLVRKAGDVADRPNLAWARIDRAKSPRTSVEELEARQVAAMPVPTPAVEPQPADRANQSAPQPPPDPPPTPDAPPPADPPRPADVYPPKADTDGLLLGARDARARSVLRAIAWWARGASTCDLLTYGHDSWSLFRDAMDRWLDDPERWDRRNSAVRFGPNDLIHVVVSQAAAFAPVTGKGSPLHWLGERKAISGKPGAQVVAGALDNLDDDVVRHSAHDVLRAWIAGTTDDWDAVAIAVRVWCGLVVDASFTTEVELRHRVLDIQSNVAEETLAMLDELSSSPKIREYEVACIVALMGDVSNLFEPLVSEESSATIQFSPIEYGGSTFFRLVTDAPLVLVRVVSPLRGRTAESVSAEGIRTSPRLVRNWALSRGREVRVFAVADVAPLVVLAEEGTSPPPRAVQTSLQDVGWWRSAAWFSPVPPPVVKDTWTPKNQEGFGLSRDPTDVVDRLVALWVAVEHQWPNGSDGSSVVEMLALASVSLVLPALQDAASKATEWVDPNDLTTEPGCAWAKSRVAALDKALESPSTLRSVLRTAVSRSAWIWRAVFQVRCMAVHEGWRAQPHDVVRLEHLDRVASHLFAQLLDHQARARWERLSLAAHAAGELPTKEATRHLAVQFARQWKLAEGVSLN